MVTVSFTVPHVSTFPNVSIGGTAIFAVNLASTAALNHDRSPGPGALGYMPPSAFASALLILAYVSYSPVTTSFPKLLPAPGWI